MTSGFPPTGDPLDRLDLELRALPGVVAVGFADEGASMVVQVVVAAGTGGVGSRDRIRRVTKAYLERPLTLEIIVDQAADHRVTSL